MARTPLLAFSLASALLLAGLAAGQTGSGTTGSSDVHRASATLSANCAMLAKANGTSGSGAGGAGGNGTGGNGTSGSGGSLPLCMTPSRITAPSGARAVLLTFTNSGSTDLCLDARSGAISATGNGTNGTTGSSASGNASACAKTGTTAGSGMQARTMACDATGGTGSGSGSGAGGTTSNGTSGNGTGNGTSGGANGSLAMPALVMAGDATAVCIPLATTGVTSILLADSGVIIGQITRSATGGIPTTTTPATTTPGTTGTGGNATNDTGEESVGGDNGVPGPGLVLVLAAAAFVAVAWRRKK